MNDLIVLVMGSNTGNRFENIKKALQRLPISVLSVSPVYSSAAMLPVNAPSSWNIPFFNMAVSGYTNLSPLEFLEVIKDIEVRAGRTNITHWSPRPIDIDILLWGEQAITSENLTVPHIGLPNRDFVLIPMCDVCPNFTHPTINKTIQEITLSLSDVNLTRVY